MEKPKDFHTKQQIFRVCFTIRYIFFRSSSAGLGMTTQFHSSFLLPKPAIVVGLSVGLSTSTTTTTTTTMTTSTAKPFRDWVFVINTYKGVKAPLILNGYGRSKVGFAEDS